MKYTTKISLMVVLLTITSLVVNAQVVDDFSDGDFTSNPVWSGETGEFEVVSGQLNLNAPALDAESHLVTANTSINNMIWGFWAKMDFATSSTSKTYVYLVSDQENLESDLNGYYVLIGGTPDEISLYKQTASSSQILIDGADTSIESSIVEVRIMVTRDALGNWELFRDVTGGSSFISEGTFLDNDFTTTAYFGFRCDYIASRSTKFHFDDISLTPSFQVLDVSNVSVKSKNSILITYNKNVDKPSSEMISNYSIDNSTTITLASRSDIDADEVILTTSDLSTDDYQLIITSVEDEDTSTPLVAPLENTFSYLQLTLEQVEIISANELQLIFNDELDQTSAEILTNYSVDNSIGQPNSATINVSDAKILNLTFDNSFQALTDYTLTYGNINNEVLNSTITNGTTENFDYVIPLVIESAHIVSKTQLTLTFNLDLDETSAETVLNYSINNGIGNPQNAVLSEVNPKIVTLTLETDLSENNYVITLDNVEDAGNNAIIPGSTSSFSYLPLEIIELSILDNTHIQLSFNQEVDLLTSENAANYLVDFEIGTAVSAARGVIDFKIVLLTFSNSFVNNNYELRVNAVENLSGNAFTENISQALEYIVRTNFRSIVINEIFADPTPTIVLPNAEFVELQNVSNKTINIGDFDLSDGTIGDFALAPNKQVILTPTANTSLYESFGDVVGVSSWNTLTNGGESILLKDNLGNLVDSISFLDEWHELEKIDGGWSLEQINPELECNYRANWSSSTKSEGGTPGSINSIYDIIPDGLGPSLVNVSAIADDMVRLAFNEPMDLVSLNTGIFSISYALAELAFTLTNPTRFSIDLDLEEPLISGNIYQITAGNVTDCAGNPVLINVLEFDYDIEPPVLERIIIISLNTIELVFDEVLAEIEAVKESNFEANNQLESPKSATLNEADNSQVILTFENIFLPQVSNTLVINNLKDEKGNALIAPFETSFLYDQTIDTVLVLSINQLDILFNDPVNKSTATNILNYSVDDEIGNPNLTYVDQTNTNLFHLIFEKNFDDNKELILSTQNIKSASGDYLPTPEYTFIYDTRAPRVEDLKVLNENTLQIYFDEIVDQSSAESVENYYYNDVFSNTRTLSENDSTVRIEFEEPFEREKVYELLIDNVKDLSGNGITTKIKKEFVYDVFSPKLDSILVVSATELVLIFNESLEVNTSSIVDNYLVGQGIGSPSSAIPNLENGNEINLIFSSGFPEISAIDISISNLEDIRGNSLTTPIDATFDYSRFDISIIQMLSHDHLEIVFNKTPREDLAIEISNYAINQTQAISTINSDNIKDRRLILNLESSLTDKSVNTLMVQNLLDENENHISKTEYLFSFDSKYSGMRVINDNTLELEFEVGLDQEVLPDKLQFILAPDTSNPIAVFGDLEDNKILRLTFEDKFNSDIAYSIFWPQLVNEFGNQIPAFWVEFVKDETAPELVKIDVLSSKTIRLVFDESLDQNTTGIKSNYELSPNSGNIESVEYNEATTSIILIFSQSFINETDYTLLTKNIKDISGNLILPSNNNFTFIAPYIPKQGDLLFTEIMADPSPSKGLPDSEYIEIFNNSTEDILLNQVFLSDRTSKTKLSNDTLASQSYILLVPSASVELFPNSNITGVSNFPSLGNSEDSLTISLDDLTILDVVDYSDDWYRVNEKKAGGYSLERLIFGNKCLPSLNWIASDNSTGGTPGIENSLFNTEPDKTAPEIIEIAFISVNTLEIIFNEAMDFESLINGSYDFSAEFEIDQLIPSGDGRDILTIALNQNPKTGSLYNLLISEISDCAGNMMEPYTFIFGVGEKPKFNELLITEIMADPDPEVGQPQSEYLELYNASIKTLELSGLIIQDGNGTTELSSFALLPDTYLILAPSGGVGLFAEAEVLSVSGWRSLSNNGETISIYNGSELVFSVSYEKDWYKNGNKEEGGWSLEMIDVQNPCGGINNWTASEDISGGTPGRINSVVTNNPDNLGPQLIKAIAQDNQNIKLVFDEKLNPEQFSLGSLTIEPQIRISGFSTNEIILNEAYISLIDEIIPNETYTITATNFTDCVGNFIRNDNNSAVFVLAEVAIEGDVIINEVLFNPQSGGVDFVEVYNRSEKAINFQKWKLGNLNNANEIESDIISTEDLILLSGEFLVFTPDAVILKADYPISDETTFIKVSPFPTYSDADGTVILLDSLDNVIDLMKYESAYHFNLLDDVDGVSLERISFDGDSNDSNNWKSAASTSGFATPGLMNSQFKTNIQTSGILTIDPKVFVPDNTGVNDFTTINYQLQNAGNFANVNVYDAAGRLVKTIAQGDLLSTSGFFTWDGTDNSGSRARVGYYAIYFETFDSNGNKEMMKETVVLGIRF